MTAADMVAVAEHEVGYREHGTNLTKYNKWLGPIHGYPEGGFGYPWCHSFQSWVAAHSGNAEVIPRTAGCEVGVAWFKQNGRFHGRSATPQVGDLVYYGPGGGTHVELVTAVSATKITTIGGNTSGTLGGRFFNGDGVYKKPVQRSSARIHGYGRPAYTTVQEDDMDPSTVFTIPDYWRDPKRNQFSHDKYRFDFLVAAGVAETRAYGKRILAQLEAQKATIDKLVDAVAASHKVDLDALKREIHAAIESAAGQASSGDDEHL
ncbi:MAG TPA: CHAP domain-containing protein [Streptosporangiaceae bacterium]